MVLTTTVAGVAGVLSFHAHQPAASTVVAGSTGSTGAAGAATGTPAPSSGSSSSGAGRTRTAVGDAIDTQYGAAQVQVTVTDGRITDVQALALQGNDPKSVQISGYAAPLLRQSALQKQSAAIDMVSGATYTSTSYEASLQSALDKLGFKAADGSRGTAPVPQATEGGGPGGDGGPPDGFFGEP
jgi:uncharacterized protein with FMN-binding domain